MSELTSITRETTAAPRRVILMDMSDMHSGNRFGLLNPATELLDEDPISGTVKRMPVKLNAPQEFIWGAYQSHLAKVREIAGDDEIIVIHNGDATQGNKHPELLVSDRTSDQIMIARDNLLPWLEMPNVKKLRVTIGTEAHNLGKGTSEFLLAEILKQQHPQADVRAIYHDLITIDGFPVDVSHHGPGQSVRYWLNGNLARLYLQNLMMAALMAGQTPPALVLRAHFHTWINEVVTLVYQGIEYTSRIVVTPSYCMISDHARQALKSISAIQIGGAAFEIIGGEIRRVYRLVETLDVRMREEL